MSLSNSVFFRDDIKPSGNEKENTLEILSRLHKSNYRFKEK